MNILVDLIRVPVGKTNKNSINNKGLDIIT